MTRTRLGAALVLVLPVVVVGCVTSTIDGEVVAVTGEAIADATVIDAYDDRVSTSSDTAGAFVLDVSGRTVAGRKQSLLRVVASGYAPQVKTVPLRNSVSTYKTRVVMNPVTEVPLDPGSSTVVGTIDTGNGETSFTVTVDGNEESGRVLVYGAAAPGDGPGTMRDIDDPSSRSLQSGGMFYVAIHDEDGAEVHEGIDYAIAMGSFEMAEMEDAGPVQGYSLDADGYWTSLGESGEPGVGPEMIPPAFGWTNCDRSVPTACVRGRLRTGDDANCIGGSVSGSGPSGFTSADTSAPNGEFCITGGFGRPSTLRVGGQAWTVTMPDMWGDCTVPESCAWAGEFTVPPDECGETAELLPEPESAGPGPALDPSCQIAIDQAHDNYDSLYDCSACCGQCADQYFDCLEGNNCSDIDGCASQLSSCFSTCGGCDC